MRNLMLPLSLLLVLGCSGGTDVDAGAGDGAIPVGDAGASDGSVADDAGGGTTDSGTTGDDAGATDGGMADADAGLIADAGLVDSGTTTMCMGPPVRIDPSDIGRTCDAMSMPCPSGYACEALNGIVLTFMCEILCTDTRDCPRGTACHEFTDKAGTRNFCQPTSP